MESIFLVDVYPACAPYNVTAACDGTETIHHLHLLHSTTSTPTSTPG